MFNNEDLGLIIIISIFILICCIGYIFDNILYIYNRNKLNNINEQRNLNNNNNIEEVPPKYEDIY